MASESEPDAREVVFAVVAVRARSRACWQRLVGARGIGQVFFEAFRGFDYHATSAILIIIIATVTVLDIASQRLRKLVV